MKKTKLGRLLLISSLFLITIPANAASFNPNIIIDDEELENFTTMSEFEIQEFLTRHGVLGAYSALDIDGQYKTAASIIYRVARDYRLNPQFLLTILQREQGLVEDESLTEDQLSWATGYAICDSCQKNHPGLEQYRGFVNQLDKTAKRLRENFLRDIDTIGYTLTGWGPGITKSTDGASVTPANRATAALYTYTPHIAGNRLFWRLWQKWFHRRYPDGSILQSNDDEFSVWLIENGLKRKIASRVALFSRFDPRLIIQVTGEELQKYDVGRPILFPDFSLLRSPGGTVYLIRGNERHGFPSANVLRGLGFNGDEIIDVDWSDLNLYEEAEPITLASAYPVGALLQDRTTGGIYYIEDNKKYPIWSREILASRFTGQRVSVVSPDELDNYITSEPVTLREGALIGLSGAPDIFVISNGERHPIPSSEIFEKMGWNWQNVIWASEKTLSLHPLGDPIFIEDDLTSLPQISQVTSNF